MLQEAWYSCGRLVVNAYAQLMLRPDIVWHTPLPSGPKIFAIDHPTTTDPLFVSMITPEPMHMLITEMAFNVPVVGQSLRWAGHVSVGEGHRREAFEAACRLLLEGRNVAIFPAGALSPLSNSAQKAHSGAVRMALRTGAPVIPVGIGVQREQIHYMKTTVEGITAMARWYPFGPYAMTIGEPLYLAGDVEDRDCVHSQSERMMQRIAYLSSESDRRVGTAHARGFDWLRAQSIAIKG